jgi:hypothetical protein
VLWSNLQKLSNCHQISWRDTKMTLLEVEMYKTVIIDYQARNKALELKVKNLEYILAQRIVLTENKYKANASRFDNLERMAYEIFADNPGIGFTYPEIQDECKLRYPNVPWTNFDRRIRQLATDNYLWKDIRLDGKWKGKVQFWLKLEEQP